jgi:hypothetical protein
MRAAIIYAQFSLRILRPDVQIFSRAITSNRAMPMWIMVVYVLIVVICETIVVGIGFALDPFYPPASLPVSLSLFFAVLWLSWVLAVRLTEPKHVKASKPAR